MTRIVRATLKGLRTIISDLFFLLFPDDHSVGPSYYRESSKDHNEYLPGFHGRGVIRARHTWRPPLADDKLPVED